MRFLSFEIKRRTVAKGVMNLSGVRARMTGGAQSFATLNCSTQIQKCLLRAVG